jgi:hypothetical protein
VKQLSFDEQKPQNPFIVSTSQLTLGGMANSFRRTDQMKSNELTEFLIEKMEYEKDTVQRILVLGNTGSFLIFPFLKSFIDGVSVSEQVRLEAIAALRLIDHPEVTTILNKLIDSRNADIGKTAKVVTEFREQYFKNN